MTVFGTALGVLGALVAAPAAVTIGILVDELWFRHLESKRRKPDKETSSGAG